MLIGVLVAVCLGIAVWLLLPEARRGPRPAFDGERALAHVYRQVEFGPRVPGSDAHRQTLRYLVDTLATYADRVSEHTFTYVLPSDSSRTFAGTNVIASFQVGPEIKRRVMLAAHWDTRAVADRDPDASKRTEPVPGANDGASGVAVLLEMARLLHQQPPPNIGVDVILFDLEDAGEHRPDGDTTGVPFAIGSEQFARDYADYRPEYGILLDMVCDRQLRIPREAYSHTYARPVLDKVWDAADEVGATVFADQRGRAVMDDHVPFLQRGIRVVDLIHTPFPDYWHTTADTPEKCSAESLQQVGDVVVEVVYRGQ